MFDESVVARLVGLSGELRPAISASSPRIVRALENNLDTVPIEVVGHGEGAAHMESADARLLALDHRAVVVDLHESLNTLRLEGSLTLLPTEKRFRACFFPLALPETLQRRRWARSAITVGAQIAVASDAGEAAWHSTTTSDLSAGGGCVLSVEGFEEGMAVRMILGLVSGEFQVTGRVLQIKEDGTTRIMFFDHEESELQRLLQHHVYVQASRHFPYARS